jgi:uncharacterized Tic20 family protein
MGAPLASPPPGYDTEAERYWALSAHLGGIFGLFIPSLVVLVLRGEWPTLRAHAVEALNFQITWSGVLIVTLVAAVCSFGTLAFLPLIVWAVMIVFSVIGGVKANQGYVYRYPLAIRLVN